MDSKHSDAEAALLSDEEGSTSTFVPSVQGTRDTKSRAFWRACQAILVLISVGLNIFLIGGFTISRPTQKDISLFAGLERNFPKPIMAGEEFVNVDDINATSEAWGVLSGDEGVVALTDEYREKMRLPYALRFPWDQKKGVYLLQGFHNLHCLRTIYRSIILYDQGKPQRIALSHILHCLDELRQDVICNADDTPRYAGFQYPEGTGKGQVKMCRDWSKLEQWATENTACFKHEDEVPDALINRFKSCPDGRKLWPPEEDPDYTG